MQSGNMTLGVNGICVAAETCKGVSAIDENGNTIQLSCAASAGTPNESPTPAKFTTPVAAAQAQYAPPAATAQGSGTGEGTAAAQSAIPGASAAPPAATAAQGPTAIQTIGQYAGSPGAGTGSLAPAAPAQTTAPFNNTGPAFTGPVAQSPSVSPTSPLASGASAPTGISSPYGSAPQSLQTTFRYSGAPAVSSFRSGTVQSFVTGFISGLTSSISDIFAPTSAVGEYLTNAAPAPVEIEVEPPQEPIVSSTVSGQQPETSGAISNFAPVPVTIGSITLMGQPETNEGIGAIAGEESPVENTPTEPSASLLPIFPATLSSQLMSESVSAATTPAEADADLIDQLSGQWAFSPQYLDMESELAQDESDYQGVQAQIAAWQEWQNAGLCDTDCSQSLSALQAELPDLQSQIEGLQTSLAQAQSAGENSTSPSELIAQVTAQPGYAGGAPGEPGVNGIIEAEAGPVSSTGQYTGYQPPSAASANQPSAPGLPAQNIIAYQQTSPAVSSPLTSLWNSLVNWLTPAPSSSAPPAQSCSLLTSLFGGCAGWSSPGRDSFPRRS